MPENIDTIRLSGRVRHRAVADEGVLVHLEHGRVLVVNEVGLHLVQALAGGPRTLDALVSSVVEEFEVEPEQARADAVAFFEQLHGEAAVEWDGSPESSVGKDAL